MHELCRSVRFCVDFSSQHATQAGKHNTFAGWPSMQGMGVFYELEIAYRGKPDPKTGYVVNISDLDRTVHENAVPLIQLAVQQRNQSNPAHLLRQAFLALHTTLSVNLSALTWKLTPFYALTLKATAMDQVLIRQRFDFAAAHRLHSSQLGDEENRMVFGKCNNFHGHGHNYQIEVAVTTSLPDPPEVSPFSLQDLERVVHQTIIERFDHSHLNLDTAEFADLIPSVENIARVSHDLLRDPITQAGGSLDHVTVWETEKTSCQYPTS